MIDWKGIFLFFSVCCGLFIVGCVIFRSVKSGMGGPINAKENPVKWYSTSLREILTCISIAELTFSCHFNMLPMHGELRKATRTNKRVILCLSMGITFLMNFCVSFFGYMQVSYCLQIYLESQKITNKFKNVIQSCPRNKLV